MNDISKVSIDTMEHSGYKAKIMKADRLKGELAFGLPPGRPIDVIPLEALPGCPDSWIREAGSYVVPVDTEHGIWFDWTMNERETTGIIASVKGMNPVTGLKIDELKLEQYRDQCPTHKIPFGHDRYCEKCKYNWPGQNYVATPNTLWWDGFRNNETGDVNQFFFTDEEMRDVASAVIGKQNTVPAFGFAFYRNKRVVTRESELTRGAPYFGIPDFDYKPYWLNQPITYYGTNQVLTTNLSDGIKKSISEPVNQVFCCCAAPSPTPTEEISARSFRNTVNKEVSIGAGAKINQKLLIDTLPLSEWIPEVQATIRLYFVFGEQLETIIRNGGIKIPEKIKNGYMNGIIVG